MQCWKVKTRLSRYLAGECQSSELTAIERHLASCSVCEAELEEIRHLDRQLDLWQVEPIPSDFWTSVMAEVGKTNTGLVAENIPINHPIDGGHKWSESRRQLAPLLRDLVAAAAVTLILFWNTGAWIGGGQMLAAGKSVNGIVDAYDRVANTVLQQAAGAAGEYTNKIFLRGE